MTVYFQQLPDLIKAEILYKFKGLQHPTAVLIKNIINEIEKYEGYQETTTNYYNEMLEKGTRVI